MFRKPMRLEQWIAFDGAVGADVLLAVQDADVDDVVQENDAQDDAQQDESSESEEALAAFSGIMPLSSDSNEIEFEVDGKEVEIEIPIGMTQTPDNTFGPSGEYFLPFWDSDVEISDWDSSVTNNMFFEVTKPENGRFSFLTVNDWPDPSQLFPLGFEIGDYVAVLVKYNDSSNVYHLEVGRLGEWVFEPFNRGIGYASMENGTVRFSLDGSFLGSESAQKKALETIFSSIVYTPDVPGDMDSGAFQVNFYYDSSITGSNTDVWDTDMVFGQTPIKSLEDASQLCVNGVAPTPADPGPEEPGPDPEDPDPDPDDPDPDPDDPDPDPDDPDPDPDDPDPDPDDPDPDPDDPDPVKPGEPDPDPNDPDPDPGPDDDDDGDDDDPMSPVDNPSSGDSWGDSGDSGSAGDAGDSASDAGDSGSDAGESADAGDGDIVNTYQGDGDSHDAESVGDVRVALEEEKDSTVVVALEERAVDAASVAVAMELAKYLESYITTVQEDKATLESALGRLQEEYLFRNSTDWEDTRDRLRELFESGNRELVAINRILTQMRRQIQEFREYPPDRRDGLLAETIRDLLDSAERRSGETNALTMGLEAVADLLQSRRADTAQIPGEAELAEVFNKAYEQAMNQWLAKAAKSDPMGKELMGTTLVTSQ